jgi:hypothetical protein
MTTPSIILEELLRFREATNDETAELEYLSHDEICTKISDQLCTILDSFEKYGHISYVVQGPRDQGVDILLKETKLDEPETYIALQVKSYREVADKESDLSKQLKAGLFDAGSKYGSGLQRYYILLFGHSKIHFKRISAITNEFSNNKLVRVITPRFLQTFINLPSSTLSAVVDRYLSDEDYVRLKACSEVAGYTEAELCLILVCLSWVFENLSDVLPTNFFEQDRRISELIRVYGSDELERAISRFNDTDFEMYAESHSIRLRTENFPAIRALYFDIQVRYKESSDELLDHLFEFLSLELVG